MMDPSALADKFAELLKAELTPREWRGMRSMNARPEYDLTKSCASHEFLDANMVMLAAWEACGLGDMRAESVADAYFWNTAWSLAKERHLTERS